MRRVRRVTAVSDKASDGNVGWERGKGRGSEGRRLSVGLWDRLHEAGEGSVGDGGAGACVAGEWLKRGRGGRSAGRKGGNAGVA